MRRTSLWIVIALLGFALAASSEDARKPTANASTDPILISQKGKVFQPEVLTVKKGGSVVFRNDDPVTHNVFSRTEGSQFNLKMQKPGQEDVVKFEEAGEVTVRCAIHPTMKLTIHVEE
jgi:plastocyanin